MQLRKIKNKLIIFNVIMCNYVFSQSNINYTITQFHDVALVNLPENKITILKDNEEYCKFQLLHYHSNNKWPDVDFKNSIVVCCRVKNRGANYCPDKATPFFVTKNDSLLLNIKIQHVGETADINRYDLVYLVSFQKKYSKKIDSHLTFLNYGEAPKHKLDSICNTFKNQ